MPTKPVTTFVVATDGLFGSGPAVGLPTRVILPSPAQGYIPGTGVNGEHFNYTVGITGDWITDWISQGSELADADAHLVETDSTGRGRLFGLVVGGNTFAPAAPAPSLIALSPASGSGIGLLVDNTTVTGESPFVVTSNTAASTAAAADIQNLNGTGDVLTVQSASANTGRGIVVFTLDANPAPLRLVGRNLPGGPALGDIYVDDTTNEERLRVYHSGAMRSVWTTPSGFARAFNTDRSQSSTMAGGFQSKVTAAFVAGDGLISGAVVHVRATCEIGQSVTTGALNLRLRDLTAAADVIASEAQHANSISTAADEKMVTLEADYTLPASGARSFALQFESNGVATVYIRRASIEVTGQY